MDCQPLKTRTVTILGATGSVGQTTLRLLRQHPQRFAVGALVAGQNVAALAALAREFRPRLAVIADAGQYTALKAALAGTGIPCAAGPEAVCNAASLPVDVVVAAIVGAAGLLPAMAAIQQGGTVALANKEALVCAGPLMMEAARRHGTRLLPIDSEHNAIFQVLTHERRQDLVKIALTASGGPFRNWTAHEMARATPEQALNHPVWRMGPKISIDSATLMNKGLEIIEACHLFDLPEARVEAVIHPQSVIHGLAWYCDGSVLAQLGPADMAVPVAYALGWPERLASDTAPLDLLTVGNLAFEPVDDERFPCPGLARAAVRAGGMAPAILNAANEEAVAAFLARQIYFSDIAAVCAATLASLPAEAIHSLEEIQTADAAARRLAREMCQRRAA
jgi:1-deoxy-D-xylulose-5-phosphate reductoisomerase